MTTPTQPAERWQLVPVEPTEEMHAAAVRTIVRCKGNDDFPPRVWRTMLAAAPKAPPMPDEVREALEWLEIVSTRRLSQSANHAASLLDWLSAQGFTKE